MSFGNDGNGRFPPPQMWSPQAPPAPMPPTAQQPAFVPFPSAVSPAGGAGESVLESDLPIQLALPPRCACCLGQAEMHVASVRVVTRGRANQRRTIHVPYCARCAAHVKAGSRRRVTIGFAASIAGAIAPLALFGVWTYAPTWLFVASAPALALGVCALADFLWKVPEIDRTRGCTSSGQPAAWIAGFVWGAPTSRVRFTNATLANEVSNAHHGALRPVAARGTFGGRWVAAPIVAALAVVPLFFATHGHVYIDNPSTVPVTVRVDDGAATVEVGAWTHESLYVPIGATEFDAVVSGAPADRFEGTVEGFGTHVATLFGAGCYAVFDRGYGTASSSIPRGLREPPGARWHTLHDVDYVFDMFPTSVSVGQGQSGATRRRFARVDCASGVPM